jgi:hypothetical protein
MGFRGSNSSYPKNLTNLMEHCLSWEADSHSAGQDSPHFYGTRRCVTVFTAARNWALSGARWIHNIFDIHFNIILPLLLGLRVLDLHFSFLTKILCYMSHPFHHHKSLHSNHYHHIKYKTKKRNRSFSRYTQGLVFCFHASCSKDLVLEFRPVNRLSWPRVFVVFVVPSRRISG